MRTPVNTIPKAFARYIALYPAAVAPAIPCASVVVANPGTSPNRSLLAGTLAILSRFVRSRTWPSEIDPKLEDPPQKFPLPQSRIETDSNFCHRKKLIGANSLVVVCSHRIELIIR